MNRCLGAVVLSFDRAEGHLVASASWQLTTSSARTLRRLFAGNFRLGDGLCMERKGSPAATPQHLQNRAPRRPAVSEPTSGATAGLGPNVLGKIDLVPYLTRLPTML